MEGLIFKYKYLLLKLRCFLLKRKLKGLWGRIREQEGEVILNIKIFT